MTDSGQGPAGWEGSPPPGATDLAEVGGLSLCYELVGDPAGPLVVLINGLGGQLIDWDPDLLAGLRTAGMATLRFDNRDAGLSSSGAEPGGAPTVSPSLPRRADPPTPAAGGGGRDAGGQPAYTLADMADDVVGLLDHVGVDAAHVMGVSLGGMIAQLVAVRHPRRVRSLTSVMSTTGAPGVGQPTDAALRVLLSRPPEDRNSFVEWELDNHRVIGSPGFPTDTDRLRRKFRARFDRARRPDGTARQLAAILAATDRTAALATVRCPTLVVHGEADALVGVSGGRATAAAVPGAELLVVSGMGHEVPPPVVPHLVAAVARVAARADERVAAHLVDTPAGFLTDGGPGDPYTKAAQDREQEGTTS